MKIQPTDQMRALLAMAETNEDARYQLAKALEVPLRKGIMAGDITFNIFEQVKFDHGRLYEYPVDLLAPGTEKEFTAYTIPNEGRLPEKQVEGDYVTIPAYEVGNSISVMVKYWRDADWNVQGRMMEILEAGHVKKNNDDAWHTILAAGVDRNIVVYDSTANSGQFTKRLLSLAKTVMRRNGGGNSTSMNRGKLTDVYLSPELVEDIRNWGVDQVDEVTRRSIYTAEDGSDTINRIFSVNLHDLDELGEGQEYQNYYTSDLAASLVTGDLELLVGLDLNANDCFINPVREYLRIEPDEMLKRVRKMGWTSIAEHGWASMDGRRVILLNA
jgi:hypothetical protein